MIAIRNMSRPTHLRSHLFPCLWRITSHVHPTKQFSWSAPEAYCVMCWCIVSTWKWMVVLSTTSQAHPTRPPAACRGHLTLKTLLPTTKCSTVWKNVRRGTSASFSACRSVFKILLTILRWEKRSQNDYAFLINRLSCPALCNHG